VPQDTPDGIPGAILNVKELFEGHSLFVVLGDNFLYGPGLGDKLNFDLSTDNAQIYSYLVSDPRAFGVVEYDVSGKCMSIVEKPAEPKSNWVSIGSYYFPNDIFERLTEVKITKNNETQIVDVLNNYLSKERLDTVKLGRGYVWFDLGNHEKLFEAANFIRSVQNGQGYKIADPFEIAKSRGMI